VLLIERRIANCGLSSTEASQGEAPKYIGIDTEARKEFCLTTPVAPTGER
jgi:hypothetical protein